MAEPIVEQIAQWLEAALASITEANGYQQDLTVVRPEDPWDESTAIGDLTTLLAQDDPERMDPRSTAGIRWRQPFLLVTFFAGRGGTGLSLDTRINRVRADIEKRLGVEIAKGPGPNTLCSALADDIEILPATIGVDPDAKLTLLVCAVAVSYRVSATDPYSQ